MPSKSKSKKKIPKQIKCKDCGKTYNANAPHQGFCPAKTCNWCGDTFPDVIPIFDDGNLIEGQPERVCETCLSDSEEQEYEGEEDYNYRDSDEEETDDDL